MIFAHQYIDSDGCIEIRDRAKDIIIAGGENMSSIEVENALYLHPSLAFVAVVAMPDDKWGAFPCAFVELAKDTSVNEDELIDHAGQRLARFQRPKQVIFDKLPTTSTGKILKNVLRERLPDRYCPLCCVHNYSLFAS